MDPKLEALITRLDEKYKRSGQDILAYIEGMIYSEYVPYWDYIHLDTLLTLQKPKTDIKDEMIFIMYHQVTELYFKMILHEIDQISERQAEKTFLIERLSRINRYFTILVDSFNVMTEGMEHKQFMQFRMALLPASGFQSAQYRKIEISSTDMFNLIDKDHRSKYTQESSIEEMLASTYWRAGATMADTGEKTLTLKQFEEKYDDELFKMANDYKGKNMWRKYMELNEEDKADPEVIKQLRNLDTNVNVNWPLAHFRTAARYLAKDSDGVPATGGTNWQKYLPSRIQKRVFYPSLWSQFELDNWGKAWVMDAIKPYQDKGNLD